jgi:hypothetical protein
MANGIFGIPNDPTLGASNWSEVTYQHASKIIISYPSFDDWRKVYDPGDLFHRFNDQRFSPDAHQSMRLSHVHSVLNQLDLIFARATGKAVLHQLDIGPPFDVTIYPYELRSTDGLGASARKPGHVFADTVSTYRDNKQYTDTRLAGTPICGNSLKGQWVCAAATGTGFGSGVAIYYSKWRAALDSLFSTDEALVHELVHALRFLHGKMRDRQAPPDYGGNQEEFVAQLIENIYRSEKGLPPYDYVGNPIDGAKFLTPTARLIIGDLKSFQPRFFDALKSVRATFNPIQQFAP